MQLVRVKDPEFLSLWGSLVSGGGELDALYGPKNLAYYREYSGNPIAEDVSLLVAEESTSLCGVMAFRCALASEDVEISCYGLPILYLERAQAPVEKLAQAQRLLRKGIDTLLEATSTKTIIRYRDRMSGGGLSQLGRLLLDRGGEATSSFTQVIDLSQPEEALHKGLTKAYKWAVNWGKKNLVLNVLDRTSITAAHFEQFRLLHVAAAGRETRTHGSWALQYDMVLAGEAFCVFATLEGTLVSAALFPHSKSHCFYGVSAARRDLFDKPISHGVIWVALLHAKMLGLRDFEMGEQLFPMAPRHSPTQKELGISFFKRAFGGDTRVFLDICLRLSCVAGASPSS